MKCNIEKPEKKTGVLGHLELRRSKVTERRHYDSSSVFDVVILVGVFLLLLLVFFVVNDLNVDFDSRNVVAEKK